MASDVGGGVVLFVFGKVWMIVIVVVGLILKWDWKTGYVIRMVESKMG